MNYYNENDPFAAAWLRELIKAGHIPDGYVDERSIIDVNANDLTQYTQCHFFAGIGGWSYALRLAKWSVERPVWTGSCPCQPFSAAGQAKGFADERHLWPAFHNLIAQCRPPVVFGEQVASKDGLGWLDHVQADLEGTGYASAAVDICAAGVGAPHLRQRLWFVAERVGDTQYDGSLEERESGESKKERGLCEPKGSGATGGLADTPNNYRGCGKRTTEAGTGEEVIRGSGSAGSSDISKSGPTNGFWRNADWLFCRDGKWRSVEPGTFPLANGVPSRVGKLRGYGNAIVPEVAKEVIASYMEIA